MLWWLRLCLPMQGGQVRSLAEERRSHIPCSQKNQNIRQKQYCNKFNKYPKMVHIKKKNFKAFSFIYYYLITDIITISGICIVLDTGHLILKSFGKKSNVGISFIFKPDTWTLCLKSFCELRNDLCNKSHSTCQAPLCFADKYLFALYLHILNL